MTRITSVAKTLGASRSVESDNQISRPYGLTLGPIVYDPPIHHPSEIKRVTIPSNDTHRSEVILQADPPRRLLNLCRIATLVVTSEAGYHAYYDHATVEYLRQAGVEVDWLNLPDVDVRGNGHFMFMEKNSEEIAELVRHWLEKLETKENSGKN